MLPLSSLPFHRLHKIPQQFILNLQPGILFFIVPYCLVRFGPTFRRRRYLLQLGFWPKPHQLCMLYWLMPYFRLIFLWLLPVSSCFLISSFILAGYCFILFFPDITTPPDVVLLSYIRGLFVYCPFLLVRFHSSGFCFMSF